jgi:3-oxoadipate enol-lactonase/4-carboxymuconolactone decarboxylase
MTGLSWRSTGPEDAPTLVLLNSIGSTSEMWRPQLQPLAERLRVITIDTRGHGESAPAAAGSPCTIADLAGEVLDVVEGLSIERVHLAGLSLGGMVGMWLAAHHPHRIDRLALLCTSAYLPPAQGWLDRAATVREHGTDAVAKAAIGRWITSELAERDPALNHWLIEMIGSVDDESYAQCCQAIAGMDLRPDLPRITAPTLIIAGEQDPTTPPAHAQVIADGIAGSRLRVLSPAAHLATVEAAGPITLMLKAHFLGGEQTRREVLGDEHVDRAIAASTEFSAPFQDFISRYAWGEIWNRPGLSRRERSIATLAALVALGAENELGMHVLAARRNGLSPAEIAEVLLHTAVYAGLPRANRAVAIAQQVLTED